MERAGKSLWAALRRVARPERPLDLLAAVWPLMVGQRLAGHTWPVNWKAGRVEVAVRGEEWRKQLEEMREQVRTQINKWWGSELVHEVSFVRARHESSRERKGSPGGAGQRKRGASGSTEVKLGAALKELEAPLAGIADQELRTLIARVAARYLEKQGKK